MGEIFTCNMALVSLRDLLQSPQFPSPHSSDSDEPEESSDSSQSFTFSTPFTKPNSLAYLSKKFVLSLHERVEVKKGPASPLTPEDILERKEGPYQKESSRSEVSYFQDPEKGPSKTRKEKIPYPNPFKLAAGPIIRFYESPKSPCGPIVVKPKPLIISGKECPDPKPASSTKWTSCEEKGLGQGKGKEPMGMEDPYYSADLDFSPIEEDLMELDVAQGVIEDTGNQSGPSRVRRSLYKKKGKAADKIAKERARRTKAFAKKKLGWVGNFWEKLIISEDKKKKVIEPQVGGKLVTIEEESEEWVPLKKRCKF